MTRNTALAVAVVTFINVSAASAQPNVLVNGDFESSPPPNLGNNIGHSIAPWVLGSGNQSNVVKVDGPGGFNYGSSGPESDASAPGAGVPQHYLDITNGSNDFYQSFTPQCSGEVEFGGSFSTRANSSGTASVTVREGVGTSGPIVGQTNNISLPGGNSQTDPWKLVSFTAPITASTTYSFIVHMDNNMNFDNGFVRYKTSCVDPCCPPWNTARLEDMLFYQGSAGIAQPYTLIFQPTSLFRSQIQAYIDYLNAVNPSINTITIHFRLSDAGTGAVPVAGQQLGMDYFTSWSAGGGGQQLGDLNFFTLAKEPMQVNRWYRVHTDIFLNNGLRFFSETCVNQEIDVRIQVQRFKIATEGPVLQIRRADGRIIEKRLSSVN